jgi:hypothetical protein
MFITTCHVNILRSTYCIPTIDYYWPLPRYRYMNMNDKDKGGYNIIIIIIYYIIYIMYCMMYAIVLRMSLM